MLRGSRRETFLNRAFSEQKLPLRSHCKATVTTQRRDTKVKFAQRAVTKSHHVHCYSTAAETVRDLTATLGSFPVCNGAHTAP